MGRIPKFERILKELDQSKQMQEDKFTQELIIIAEEDQRFNRSCCEQSKEDNKLSKSFSSSTSNNSNDSLIHQEMCYSSLKEKAFQLYNNKLIALNVPNQDLQKVDIDDVPIEFAWSLYSELMLSHVGQLASYMIELPGFSSFNESDFSYLINEHLNEFLYIKNSEILIKKDFKINQNDQTEFIKKGILKFFGSKFCDCMFKLNELFNKLELTDREISLIIPVLLLSTGNSNISFKFD